MTRLHSTSFPRRLAAYAATLSAAFFLLSGPVCSGAFSIVTTTSDLASIARAVAGSDATVESIATGVQDPHFLQAKPSMIVKARDADLWIRVGMELEVGWEGPILAGSRNPRIAVGSRGHLDVSETVLRLGVPAGGVSRAMGDVHPSGNPHCWLDPLNGRLIAEAVCDRLCELLPGKTAAFRERLTSFTGELDRRMFGQAALDALGGDRLWSLLLNNRLKEALQEANIEVSGAGWFGRMEPHRGKKLVTYHKSWQYLTERFGLDVCVELEPKPGVPPSASHLRQVVGQMKTDGVTVILQEPFYSRKAADFAAARTGATVVVAPNSVGGSPETADYISLIDHLVNALDKAL